METVGKALASYERVLVSGNSPFDRWYYGKQEDALEISAQRGFKVFVGKGRCASCHQVGEDYALFMDNKLHNTGVGWEAAMKKEPGEKQVLI